MQKKTQLENELEQVEKLEEARINMEEWLELAEEDDSSEILKVAEEQIRIFKKILEDFELKTLLSAEQDKNNAILEIHPGAGGTEAQDWAEMLLRMYKRWAENKGFKVRALDILPGEEAGIKSATISIEGPYAYGLLKGEKGIHRLIRISPFDASGRRHTSFASIDVYPEANKEIKIDINEEDLRIDVFRAGGPGGQSVNKTSSAVRITHIPTGIVVQCQNEKSQFRNKEIALKILKARLYEMELRKLEQEKQKEYSQKSAIAWGSQIRTYTLQPYRLVKDHRTNTEDNNVDKVLDGDLDKFIRNYLLHIHGQKKQ
jgi:peptide chain release factor 2